jgi:hypothetical protein
MDIVLKYILTAKHAKLTPSSRKARKSFAIEYQLFATFAFSLRPLRLFFLTF